MNRILCVIIWMLIASSIHAEDGTQSKFSEAINKFENKFKKEHLFVVSSPSTGDINNDGHPDFVILAQDSSDGDSGVIRMAVFLGDKNGNFKLYKISLDTFKHSNVDQSVDISNKSIYLQRSIMGNRSGSEVFQFSMVKGDLLLVGLETQETNRIILDPNNELLDSFEPNGVSRNFLTNKKRNWTEKDGVKIWGSFEIMLKSDKIKFENFSYNNSDFYR